MRYSLMQFVWDYIPLFIFTVIDRNQSRCDNNGRQQPGDTKVNPKEKFPAKINKRENNHQGSNKPD